MPADCGVGLYELSGIGNGICGHDIENVDPPA